LVGWPLKDKVVIFGDGGHARSVFDVLTSNKNLKPIAVVGLDEGKASFWHSQGVKWIHASDLDKSRSLARFGIVGIGYIHDPEPRDIAFTQLLDLDFLPATAVSPFAFVSQSAKVGPGTVVMHGAILNSNTIVGKNSIINSNTLLEHDVTVGDNSHISTSVTVNGGSKVGNTTFIGSGSILKQGIQIGNNCFVPMGSLVTASMGDRETWKKDKGSL